MEPKSRPSAQAPPQPRQMRPQRAHIGIKILRAIRRLHVHKIGPAAHRLASKRPLRPRRRINRVAHPRRQHRRHAEHHRRTATATATAPTQPRGMVADALHEGLGVDEAVEAVVEARVFGGGIDGSDFVSAGGQRAEGRCDAEHALEFRGAVAVCVGVFEVAVAAGVHVVLDVDVERVGPREGPGVGGGEVGPGLRGGADVVKDFLLEFVLLGPAHVVRHIVWPHEEADRAIRLAVLVEHIDEILYPEVVRRRVTEPVPPPDMLLEHRRRILGCLRAVARRAQLVEVLREPHHLSDARQPNLLRFPRRRRI
mmetsp:Transcript_19275/g.51173  ORF Transcript_19275/g.51173 Transcript_19275/m.51173 type:complete len:311 (-) Transcript_19275:376-1308(-)